jgi:hypothetical protein
MIRSRVVQKNYCVSLSLLLSALAMGACAADPESSTPDLQLRERSLNESGFSAQIANACLDAPTAPGCSISILDARGASVAPKAEGLGGSTLSPMLFDSAKVGNYTIYKWPATLPVRDYERLGAEMTQYAWLVGTWLHRGVDGAGEKEWASYRRDDQERAILKSASRGTKSYCETVVAELVDGLVREGSKYRQYGNCGEGREIGTCLALKAGFSEDEIRVCGSRNDHYFSLVKHSDPAKKWCILDRWKEINHSNFECGVDWDEAHRKVTYKGENVLRRNERTGTPEISRWFQDVTCVPLPAFIRMGAPRTRFVR